MEIVSFTLVETWKMLQKQLLCCPNFVMTDNKMWKSFKSYESQILKYSNQILFLNNNKIISIQNLITKSL